MKKGSRRGLPAESIIAALLPFAMLAAFGAGIAIQYVWITQVAAPAETATAASVPTQTNTASATPSPTYTATATPTETPSPTPTVPPTETPTPMASGWLTELTLEDKVGQMILAGLPADSLDVATSQLITKTRVGGVWFTRRNISSPEKVQALIADLQSLAVESGSGIPLFISVDHEGGDINRFGAGVTAFPSNMAVGAAGCGEWAWVVGQAEGAELRALGFNLNFSPVLDVNNNPLNPVIHIRSYGADPQLVATCGAQYIAGVSSTGVIPVAKHFPGHGNTAVDSHAGLPVISGSVDDLNQTEFHPFAQAVNAGVPAVMVGHLLVPALDPNLPASLSPTIIGGTLRTQMGFAGVVFTDDIARMNAISESYTVSQAAIKAVQAGADVVVMNAYQDTAQAVKNALIQAVRSGAISEARIDESVERILKLKEQVGMVRGELPALGSPPDYAADAALADQVSLDAITWKPLGNANLLPLRGSVLLVVPNDRVEIAAPDAAVKTLLGVLLQERGLNITEFTYDSTAADPGSSLLTSIVAQSANNDAVVVLTWDAALALRASYKWQRSLVEQLTAQTPNVIVVALHTPYDLRVMSGLGGYLMTYGNTPAQVRGLADVLSGWQSALGVAPFPDDALGLTP